MNDFTITLDYQKSTKGTHVFGSKAKDCPVPTLYIKRTAFQGDPPSTITITVVSGS